jgi:hypothetical protein
LGIAIQFAQRYLKIDQKQPLSGILIITQRLIVKRLTVELLLVTLGLLAIATLFMIKVRPWNAAPCATESLSSAATILAASDTFRDRLKTQMSNNCENTKNLKNYDYQTVITSEKASPFVPRRLNPNLAGLSSAGRSNVKLVQLNNGGD